MCALYMKNVFRNDFIFIQALILHVENEAGISNKILSFSYVHDYFSISFYIIEDISIFR